MEERYIYTRLDTSQTGSFRILELQPGEKEAPIICSLIHAQLNVKYQPAYEAISYVWGSSERPFPIDCDGKRLYITENLRDALVRVRLPDHPRRVWADSLCINQDDLDEKGHQVQFMGKIYSNAYRVLICLGKDDGGNAQKAMSLVKDVSDMVVQTLPECEQTYGSFPWLNPNARLLQDDRWPAYHSLLSRPWFRRGWVVQEAALAKDVVVLWGEAECSWISFMDTGIWANQRGQTVHGQSDLPIMVHTLLYQSMGGHGMRLRPLFWAENDPGCLRVPDFLDCVKELTLLNPLDRVFAFLSIIDRISQSALDIKADYSKTPQSVYTEFAVAYLQATCDLSLLQFVQHTNESIQLGTPSWVPLWDVDEWDTVLGPGLASQQDSLARFTLEQGSGTPKLTVQALLFDTVRFTSDPLRLETVKDVALLWQVVRRRDESADVYEFLQVLGWARKSGTWEAWTLQFSAYGRHLLASSTSNNLGMK